MNANIFNLGLTAAGFGLTGVFLVLIIFYISIKLMLFIFRKFPAD